MNDFFERLDRLLTALLGEGASVGVKRVGGTWTVAISHPTLASAILVEAKNPMEGAVLLRAKLREHHEAEVARRAATYAEVEAAFAAVSG